MQALIKKPNSFKIKCVFDAISTNDIDAVKYALKHYPQTINTTYSQRKWTPLMMAMKQHFIAAFQLLLNNKNMDPNIQDIHGWTALGYAYLYAQIKSWPEISIYCLGLLNHKDINIGLRNAEGYTVCECINFAFLYGDSIRESVYAGLICKSDFILNCFLKQSLDIQCYMIQNTTLLSWRSHLPDWSMKTHSKYPQDFKKDIIAYLCLFNRLNKTINARISKDIRILLLKYISSQWKQKKVVVGFEFNKKKFNNYSFSSDVYGTLSNYFDKKTWLLVGDWFIVEKKLIDILGLEKKDHLLGNFVENGLAIIKIISIYFKLGF